MCSNYVTMHAPLDFTPKEDENKHVDNKLSSNATCKGRCKDRITSRIGQAGLGFLDSGFFLRDKNEFQDRFVSRKMSFRIDKPDPTSINKYRPGATLRPTLRPVYTYLLMSGLVHDKR